MVDREVLTQRLGEAGTLWAATVALLRLWREDPPPRPARDANDGRYEAWAELAAAVVDHFGERDASEIDGPDRARLVAWVGRSSLSVDAADAVAWGLDRAGSATFAPSWRDELCEHGTLQHRLADGDPYPVADPAWNLPDGLEPASRPSSVSRAKAGELPHVRFHAYSGFETTVDFVHEADLEPLGSGLRRVATLHPNETLADFHFEWPSPSIVFPVTLANPDVQLERVRMLVRRAVEHGARIVVLPELSTNPAIVEAIQALIDDLPEEQLVVAGSYHSGEGATAENVTLGLLPDGAAPLRHAKVVPFSDELGLGVPWKEGIAPRRRLTLYHADRFRFCLLTCKDFLDGAVADAIGRLGANVICVPAMSEKTDSFTKRAGQLVADAQAAMIVANGPLRWGEGRLVEPVAAFAQPIRDRDPAVSPAGQSIEAPCASLFKLGAQAAEIVE